MSEGKVYSFRLTPEDEALVLRYARQDGLKPGTYAKRTVLNRVRRLVVREAAARALADERSATMS